MKSRKLKEKWLKTLMKLLKENFELSVEGIHPEKHKSNKIIIVIIKEFIKDIES